MLGDGRRSRPWASGPQIALGGADENRAEHRGGFARAFRRNLVFAGTEYVSRPQLHERANPVVDQRRDRFCRGRDPADLGEPPRKTRRLIISLRRLFVARSPAIGWDCQLGPRRIKLALRSYYWQMGHSRVWRRVLQLGGELPILQWLGLGADSSPNETTNGHLARLPAMPSLRKHLAPA